MNVVVRIIVQSNPLGGEKKHIYRNQKEIFVDQLSEESTPNDVGSIILPCDSVANTHFFRCRLTLFSHLFYLKIFFKKSLLHSPHLKLYDCFFTQKNDGTFLRRSRIVVVSSACQNI